MHAYSLQLHLAALVLLLIFTLAQDELPDLSQGLLKDREALLALRYRLSSFGSSQIGSWRPTGNPCLPIPWKHVTCSTSRTDPRVVEIDLSNRGVVGELAVGLRKATRLEVLNLEGNKFTGGIPNDWGKWNSFPKLRVLNLAHNELRATLPVWNRRGAWTSLQSLYLNQNQFYGGLPANWLGRYRPLRNLKVLDLSSNLLGRGPNNQLIDGWCQSEGSLSVGSGWCPTGNPVSGTAASLVSLDLSDNDLTGVVPPKWPKMFPRLQYLKLQFNNLYFLSELQYRIPTALPANWTTGSERGFPSLSILTLYPGNDYLCSLPDDDGSFQDINLAATYLIADSSGDTYGDGNPVLCPVGFTDDNPVGDGMTGGPAPAINPNLLEATWHFTETPPNYIWGFKVTVYAHDKEGDEWTPVTNGVGVLLRTYTLGLDGGVQNPGLAGPSGGEYTLTFSSIKGPGGEAAGIDLSMYPSSDVDLFKIEVAVMNLDGVESTARESPTVANV